MTVVSSFFAVRHVDRGTRDSRYPQALLPDYGAADHPRLDPSRLIRDYLVRAAPGSDDLLLGRAFVAAGPLRPSLTSSWSVADRSVLTRQDRVRRRHRR